MPLVADRRWGGVDGLYGGYVVALLVDAAAEASTYRLASFSANFVASVTGDVAIELDRVHAGKFTELLRLVLRQGDRACVYATAELLRTSAEDTASSEWVRMSETGLPIADSGDLGRARQPFDDLIELRRAEPPDVTTRTSSWARLRSTIEDSGLRSAEAVLAALLDTPTPGLFGAAEPPDFVPTIDFAVHFAPLTEWVPTDWARLDHATSWVTPHHCADEVTAWSADGRLLGAVRQTRSVRYGSMKKG